MSTYNIDGDNFELIPDEHWDKYEIEWIFADSQICEKAEKTKEQLC